MRAAAVASLLLCALAAQAQVTPLVTCWRENTGTAVTTIVFGYDNAGAAATIPAGAQNFVTPPPDAQSQPGLFASGLMINAFTMSIATAIESSASWSVDGSVVFFNRALSTPCPESMCLCPAGESGAAGPEGPRGPVGAIGLAGTAGAQGSIGADGIAGPEGAVGAAGSAGGVGPQGGRGEIGATGPAGPIGPAGAIGAKGPIGDSGPVGAIGPQGPQGPAGDPGSAGVPGDRGPIGEAGLQGPRGSRGEAGPAGAPGSRGPHGPLGFAGVNGPRGATGPRGEAGRDGADAIAVIAATIDGERVVVDRPSRLIVIATVTARAGSPSLLVDGATHMSFPAAERVMTIPIVTTIDVEAGEHIVEIEAAGAELRGSAITVLVTDRPEEPRRRTAVH